MSADLRPQTLDDHQRQATSDKRQVTSDRDHPVTCHLSRVPVFQRGQSIAEYAILVGLVLTAMVTIQTYAKRGLQARYRSVINGTMKAIAAPTQYEPYYASSTSTERQSHGEIVSYRPGGSMTRAEQDRRVTEEGAEHVGVILSADDAWQ